MKLPRGIEDTPDGYRAFVQFRRVPSTKRFPHSTPIKQIEEWRADERARLRLGLAEAQRTALPVGSFRADVVEYLKAVAAMTTYKERKRHIEMWAVLFGDRPRHSISPLEIRAQLQAWKDSGLSASACNHRRTALMHFYNVMDAHTNAPNPVAKVRRFRAEDPIPRSLDYKTIRAIFKKMQPSKSKARLQVIAWTGLPPATLKRIAPEDWQGATLFVPGRRKGRGTSGRTIGLVKEAQSALKAMNRESAWGHFDTSALNRAFKRAAKKAGAKGCTLYALRHSFITAAYLASGDIQGTAELAGHSDTRQTKRYALAALSPRAAETLAKFGKKTRSA